MGLSSQEPVNRGFFIFVFFTKIYFRFQNLQEYTPAARLPGGRHPVALLRGGRGFFVKIFAENLRANPWRTGRPAEGRPAPQAARQWGGGRAAPLCAVLRCLLPCFSEVKEN